MRLAGARSAAGRLPEDAGRLAAWWLQELLGFFPQRMVEFLAGRRTTMIAVNVDNAAATLDLLGDGLETLASAPVSRPESAVGEIDRFLRAQGLGQKTLHIGISLPTGRIFGRQLLIPSEAAHAIDEIVAQDTARRTPFKANDVLADHVIAERVNGKLRVLQWIVRREDIQNALALLKLPLERLAFITCEGTSTEKRPLIRLHRDSGARQSWYRRTMLALGCAGLLLAVNACGLKYWNQQVVLDRIGTEIAITNKKAQQIRVLVDRLQERQIALLNLRKQKKEGPRLIAIWDEVTRVLPSHSWLTELRIAELASRETQINLTGFSGAAPSLVGILDRSPIFMETALSAPVALDPSEGRERFAVQTKVRRPDLVKGDAR